MHRFILNAFFISFAALGMSAQAEDAPGVYIIYDSSNSMWGALPDGSRKYEAARTAMNELASQEFNGAEVALRMYGHRRVNDCRDSELVIGFSDPVQSRTAIIQAMSAVRPTGRTPSDLSLRQALTDFGTRTGTIILISDGIESCDADPCVSAG
jgi:Ca-activated chloride channel family protein